MKNIKIAYPCGITYLSFALPNLVLCNTKYYERFLNDSKMVLRMWNHQLLSNFAKIYIINHPSFQVQRSIHFSSKTYQVSTGFKAIMYL